MKSLPRLGRRRSSYRYNLRRGLSERRALPIAGYIAFTGFAMCLAVVAANWQARTTPPPTASAITSVTKNQVVPAPQTITITPQVATATYEDARLQSLLSSFATTHPANHWSIQIEGLGTDERSASYNATAKYDSASIFKLLLMYPLMQKTPISQWSSTQIDIKNATESLSDCVTAMLKVSDNACGEAVGDYVGWSYADTELKSIGLASTTLNDPSGPTTTAADTAYYLQGLYNGKWFDGATRNYILNILSAQTIRSGIPAGCSGCSVADKTGDIAGFRHDAGIVTYSGGAYVLSIFTDGASPSQIAQLTRQIQSHMAITN